MTEKFRVTVSPESTNEPKISPNNWAKETPSKRFKRVCKAMKLAGISKSFLCKKLQERCPRTFEGKTPRGIFRDVKSRCTVPMYIHALDICRKAPGSKYTVKGHCVKYTSKQNISRLDGDDFKGTVIDSRNHVGFIQVGKHSKPCSVSLNLHTTVDEIYEVLKYSEKKGRRISIEVWDE